MTIAQRPWWKDGVVYQIYPANIKDTNHGGIGDLAGITQSLDYIGSIGVDIIWVCPMYYSPQIDMGYEISDYESIYPPYGTVEDMETLIAETHRLGMRIVLDLVVNHTSDKHARFKESGSSKHNAKRDWYIWKPASFRDGQRRLPNKWRSNFGGSAWQLHLRRCGCDNLTDSEIDTVAQASYWVIETVKALPPHLTDQEITVRRIMTVQLAHICLMAMHKHHTAFYCLRQSISMVQILQIEDPTIMAALPMPERARRQRLYYEVFVHERFLAISDHRSVLLSHLPRLPYHDDSVERSVQAGFEQIIRLFSLIDGEFLTNWYASLHNPESIEPM